MAITTITFCELDDIILLNKETFSELVKFYLEQHPSERVVVNNNELFKGIVL